jgi:hypothetical protein
MNAENGREERVIERAEAHSVLAQRNPAKCREGAGGGCRVRRARCRENMTSSLAAKCRVQVDWKMLFLEYKSVVTASVQIKAYRKYIYIMNKRSQ